MYNNHTNPILNGILGTATSAGGVVISALPEIEAWVRIIGGVIAIISGLMTCIYMIQQLRKK
jgi:uncharacterized membrane protein